MASVRRALPLLLFVVIGLVLADYFNKPAIDVKRLILLSAAVVAVCLPLAVLVGRTWAVRVSTDGIKSYGYGLSAILLPWSAITEVRKSFNEFMGVLILETAERKKSLLIPIAIAKQPEFRDAIVKHAGAGHRLVQVLLDSVT
jgi:hypothetical protein